MPSKACAHVQGQTDKRNEAISEIRTDRCRALQLAFLTNWTNGEVLAEGSKVDTGLASQGLIQGKKDGADLESGDNTSRTTAASGQSNYRCIDTLSLGGVTVK